jgi:hypothetical protein
MPKTQTVHVPVGYALTITPDAFSSGSYVRQDVPGGSTRYTPVSLSASTAVTLGPFNEERDYILYSTGNDYTVESVFSGVFLDTDESTLSAKAPLASPAFTGSPTVAKANGTEASNLVTASGAAGKITTSSLTTGAGLTYEITWTNTSIATTSTILLQHMGGTNTKDVIFKVVPGSGSATLTIYNVDLVAALDGTILIGYLVI